MNSVPILIFLFLLSTAQSAQDAKVANEYIVTLSGDCSTKCRNALSHALRSSPSTKNCKLGPNGKKFRSSTTFETVTCKDSNVEEAEISSVLFAQSNMGDVLTISNIEQNGVVTKSSVLTRQAESAPTWGVDATDGGGGELFDDLRTCSATSNKGAGVNVWILDTGCAPYNGGSCSGYYGPGCADGDGHGTHVAGTAGSLQWGVAPLVTLHCVKVLDDGGSGTYVDIIGGIAAVVAEKDASGGEHVINLSLGGGYSSSMNNAVGLGNSAGVYFALASGNEGTNACSKSPASASGDRVFTVQAHDQSGRTASFSNYATKKKDCTDLSAPGVNVESFYLGGSAFFSGTSMAAPHVAGAVALLIGDGRAVSVASLTTNGRSIAGRRRKHLTKPAVGLDCV